MREKDSSKIENIFQAALKLVLSEGFSGLIMGNVAKEAKLATGTVYLYFKNKEDLINQLYIYLKRKSTVAYFEGYDPHAPFVIGFEIIWRNYLKTQLSSPEAGAFMEQYYRSPYLKDTIKTETDKLLQPIFDLLERGKKEKLLKDIATELLAIQLSGAIQELVRWHHRGQISLTDKAIDQAFALAWDSIKR